MPVTKFSQSQFIAASCVLALVLLQGSRDVVAQTTTDPSHPAIDWPMFDDPKLKEATPPTALHPRMPELWTAALGQQEVELRRLTVLGIAKAHERGYTQANGFIAQLRKLVESSKESDSLRRAAAQALVRMNDRESAATLLKLAQTGDMDYALVIDPALASWNHAPATAMWIERLNGETGTRATRLSAIESLGKVRAAEARGLLVKLLVDPRSDMTQRIAAARAVGAIGGIAPADLAGISHTSKAIEDRILAASAWRGVSVAGPRVSTLTALAKDSDAGVAQVALTSLLQSDPDAAASAALALTRHADAGVRTVAVQALQGKPNVAAVEPLIALLSDPVADIRESARETLATMARDASLAPAVRAAIPAALGASSSWPAQRGAVLIAGVLKDKSLVEPLLTLLAHDKPQVRIAAIWALRQTDNAAVADRFAARAAELVKPKSDVATGIELSQLIQSLALAKHAPSVALFKSLIPKNAPASSDARSAAIWGLGLLLENQTDASLANLLVARINDGRGESPETTDVRRMSAVTLSRIKHPTAAKTLEKAMTDFAGDTQLEAALRWGIEHITGKPLEAPAMETTYENFGPIEPVAGTK